MCGNPCIREIKARLEAFGMPIFEYHCSDCDKDFDAFLGHGECAEQCRLCGGSNIKRKFSRFAMRTDTYTATDVSATSKSGCAGCTSNSCATCGG